MSDARAIWRVGARATLLVRTTLLVGAPLSGIGPGFLSPLTAQAIPGVVQAIPTAAQAVPTADALRARLDSASARADAAESSYRAVLAEINSEQGQIVFVDDVRVRFTPLSFPERHRGPALEGVRRAVATLEERFGTDGTSLLDSATILLRELPISLIPAVMIGSPGAFTSSNLGRMVDAEEVEQFALRKAGSELPLRAPVLARFTGPIVDFTPSDDSFEEIARQLALSRSAAGRRCYTGDIKSCRAIFEHPASDAEALALWFEPEDYRAVVAFGASAIPQQDSMRQAARARCEAGDDTVCAEMVTQLPVRNPHGAQMRTTLAAHALDIAPRNALAVLSAADSAASPVAALARAAGVSEESLIAGWRRRTISALEAGRPSPLLLVASTAFWGFLLLELAIRRRPL